MAYIFSQEEIQEITRLLEQGKALPEKYRDVLLTNRNHVAQEGAGRFMPQTEVELLKSTTPVRRLIPMCDLPMWEMSASEFRQRCLAMLEDLPADGILVTEHGRPVVRVMPVRASNADLIGSIAGLALDAGDDLFQTGVEWDAQS